jgi:hypothetical protein
MSSTPHTNKAGLYVTMNAISPAVAPPPAPPPPPDLIVLIYILHTDIEFDI